VHVVVAGTTDVHGWFEGHRDVPVPYGGLPLFASYVAALRAANPGHVVVVDSGDVFQGTLESNFFEGEPLVKAYNAIGYDAVAVGNHEFDYGPVGPDSVPTKPEDDPLGALKRNAANAKWPFLSANIKEKATGQTPSWMKRSTIVTVAGVKLGIIGLSTPDTPNTTTPENIASLSFGDPVSATVAEAADLRARGADAVIVIAHMGGRCSDLEDVHDNASCEMEHEVMKYLQALPKGTIDGYFAGHTHFQIRQVIEGVPVVQGSAYSREFSTVDFFVDPKQHRVLRSELRPLTMICRQVFTGTSTCDPKQAPKGTALVPRMFEGRAIADEPTMAAMLQPYADRVAAKRNEPLGIRAAGTLSRNYTGESTLGNPLSDLLREWGGADIGFVNSGGIRSDLHAGDLKYGDLFEVSPFDNFPALVEMTGQQLLDALRITSTGERGFLQVSGIRYVVDYVKDHDKPMPERNRLVSVTLANGQPLDPTATYKVATIDFLAKGGDALNPVMNTIPADRKRIDSTTPIRDIYVAMLKQHHSGVPLTPKAEGRITVLNEPPKAAR